MSKLKNLVLSSIIGTSFALSSCGQFTNFPAQYHISGESKLVAKVDYNGTQANVTLPTLIIEGEPGSVGATFTSFNINYGNGSIQPRTVNATFRVDSSHLRNESGALIIGKGTGEVPVVDPAVLQFGNTATANLSPVVTMTGTDDAGWPIELQFGVPIVFTK